MSRNRTCPPKLGKRRRQSRRRPHVVDPEPAEGAKPRSWSRMGGSHRATEQSGHRDIVVVAVIRIVIYSAPKEEPSAVCSPAVEPIAGIPWEASASADAWRLTVQRRITRGRVSPPSQGAATHPKTLGIPSLPFERFVPIVVTSAPEHAVNRTADVRRFSQMDSERAVPCPNEPRSLRSNLRALCGRRG
jgi:hypothetical protein